MISGAGCQLPGFSAHLMPTERPGMLLHLFGLMALFLGIMLILCSRDLEHRGSLVAWEGMLRLGGFAIMGGYGVFGGGGVQLAIAGVFDLVIGAIYLLWLPRHLGVPLGDLLLDRRPR